MTQPDTNERDYLAGYDPTAFPPVAVAVDIALFTLQEGSLAVLLVKRAGHPYRGAWALPGGFIRPHEAIYQAAARELAEETGVARFDGHLEQLATYGAPDRDPRMRVVSVAHVAIDPSVPIVRAGGDAATARFWPIGALALELPSTHAPPLAFDHNEILRDALERVRSKLEYTSLATEFLQAPFTITALRRVYEAIWGHPLDPANFQRKILGTTGFLTPTDQFAPPATSGGRPARTYRHGPATSLHRPILRPTS